MENKTPQTKIKLPYFIISCFLMLILASALIFFPKQNWKKIFSFNFLNFAAVFTSANEGNWNDPAVWGNAYVAPTPYDLAISPTTGEIYVADNGRIFVLNPDGTASTTYSLKYNGNVVATSGIVLNQNKIYVSTNLGVILVLNLDGSTYAAYDGGKYAPINPNSVFISNSGYIYAADQSNNRIVVLNPDGTASTTYPLSFSPFAVTVSNSGKIYVSDFTGEKIDLLNPNGTASTTYDGGTFAPIYPQNITISNSGYIYVSDETNNRIVVLNPDGTASTTYDGGTFAPINPEGIKISANGNIYVADNTHSRIVVLNSDGTASTTYEITPTIVAGVDYPGVNDTANISNNIKLVNDESVRDLVIVSGGTLDLNGYTLNVFGTFNNVGTLITNGGSINQITYSDMTVNYPLTLSEDTYVNNLTLASGGTLDLNGYTIYVNGNWNNTGGELINNGGTVDMVSTSTQSILGGGTFENLEKISNVPSSLLFDSSTTTTITGKLTLQGNLDQGSANLLTIGPTGAPYKSSGKINGISPFLQGDNFAIAPSGEIYVANGSEIKILNQDGTASTSLACTNCGGPIAVSQTGEIYLLNDNSHVYVLNPDGTASTTYTFTGSYINGLAVSPSGEVYITDAGNNKLIILNPDGTTATTTNINIGGANSIALSQTGEIYVYTGSNNIAVLNSDGTANTTYHFSLPDSSGVGYSAGMTVSPSNNIYIGDNGNGETVGRLIVLNSDGSFSSKFSTVGSPTDIALDSSGKIYVDSSIGNLFRYNSDNSTDSTFNSMSAGELVKPVGIVRDSAGNIYVSDWVFNNIQKFDSSGNFIKTFDTSGAGALDLGSGGSGQLAVDSSDNIYVASGLNNKVTEFNSDGNYLGSISITSPQAVAVDNNGNIFVSSIYPSDENNILTKFNPNFSIAASTKGPFGLADNFVPGGLTVDPTNTYLYVMDTNNAQIVKLNLSDLSLVSVSDGPIESPFVFPESMTFDSAGNVYISHGGSNGGYITKLDSNFNYVADFGEGIGQVMADAENNIFIADTDNGVIQKFSPSAFSPFKILSTNSTTNTNFAYLSVSGSDNISSFPFVCNGMCTNGGYNSNWTFNSTQNLGRKYSNGTSVITYTTATSSATTTILASINITPLNISLPVNSTTTFISTLLDQNENPFSTTTNWTTSSTSIATINASGTLKAIYPGTTTVTATAGTLSTSTLVTVTYVPVLTSINISPLNPNATYGSTIQFISKTLDQYGKTFIATTTWTSSNTSIGTINTKGLFTAKNQRGTTIITARAGKLLTSTTVNVAKKFTAEGVAIEDETGGPTSEGVSSGIIPAQTTSATTSTSTETTTASTTNNLVESIRDSIVQGLKNSIITPADIQTVKEVVTSPAGGVVTKTVTAAGIVAGAGVSVSAVAFANPITFSELWLLPAKLFGLLLGALGIRRKQRPWGTVYDSITKRPLDPVYVSLINSETGKEVSGAITDIDGRYGFLVLPGKYRIEAKKTNYIEPSVKMKGKLFDEVYSDLYFGEDINVTEEGQIISKNIPMDSLSFDWNEFAKTKMNVNKFIRQRDITWAKISGIIFFIGAIVAAIALIAAPAPYNYIIAGLYVLAYILNYIVFKNKKSGTLTEKSTGAPLSFAIVKIFREGEDIPLTKKIADKFGAYYALVPKGKYYIEIDKKEGDEKYDKVFKTEVIDANNGLINMDFII
jgi:sugar lactone lactonase YvrE